jgi:transposase
MKPYSKDLRIRVLAAVDRGIPRGEVAETFGVSEPTVRRWLRLRRETGGVDPKPPSGPPARKGRALEEALPAQVSRNHDLTLEEHRELFYDEQGVAVSVSSVSRAFGRLGLPLKKSLPTAERDEAERARWHEGVRRLHPGRLVFVDECGTHTSMTRPRARAPKGERAYGKVPRNRGKNTTLLASMTSGGMGPCTAVVGSTTKAVFETYVERALAPSLRPGQVVVMDNLGAHRGDRVRALVEARGCSLLYLPPYSPDFSPIEEAFSKIKALLRKAKARARVALLEAIGRALWAITPQDAAG